MKSFEVPIHIQLRHLIVGMTADGSKKHALWPLPKLAKPERHRLIALAYWHLLCAGQYLHAREDVRT